MNKHAKSFWEDEFYSSIPYDIHKEFMDHSIAGLMDEYENTSERSYNEENKYVEESVKCDWHRREHILLLICHRLDLIRARDVVEIIYHTADENKKIIGTLTEQFKNHRHSRDKIYSEKPVY